MSGKQTPKPEPAAHGRTPDNTPIPGGGEWAWDEVAGAWVPVAAEKS